METTFKRLPPRQGLDVPEEYTVFVITRQCQHTAVPPNNALPVSYLLFYPYRANIAHAAHRRKNRAISMPFNHPATLLRIEREGTVNIPDTRTHNRPGSCVKASSTGRDLPPPSICEAAPVDFKGGLEIADIVDEADIIGGGANTYT